MAAAIVAAALFTAIVPLIVFWRDTVVAKLVGHGAPAETIWAIAALLLMSAVMAVLGFYFARHLYRIVGSVGEGEAFAPANAVRLRSMGWIAVAVHIVGIPMSILAKWVESATKGGAHLEVDLPLAGLFLAMVLFILARVFREGTRMREDLEGTV
jgi:hypothetical protein